MKDSDILDPQALVENPESKEVRQAFGAGQRQIERWADTRDYTVERPATDGA